MPLDVGTPCDNRPTAVIVEDDPALQAALTYNLERAGYRVVPTGDGPTGLAAARDAGAALTVVLLDHLLPGLEGLAVLRQLRADPATAGAAVVMLSAALDDDVRAAARAAGADDLVPKPFVLTDLLDRVHRAVAARQGGGGAGSGH